MSEHAPTAHAQAGATRAGETHGEELEVARAAHSLTQQLEALLIVAEEPLDAQTLAAAVARPVPDVRAALARLQAEYDGVIDPGVTGPGASAGPGLEGSGEAGSGSNAGGGAERVEGAQGSFAPRGFELREVPTGFRFYVRASLDAVVADFVRQERSARLSQAALETLAVIAYRQPVTRGQVAQIRAVNVDSVVRTLLSHSLVAEVGRHEETGATLYGTTAVLLDKLGISDIAELPHISPLLDDGAQGFEHEVL
ncbi:SMC-Scp complex subunit ScpB [Leucobacter sp. HY1910]